MKTIYHKFKLLIILGAPQYLLGITGAPYALKLEFWHLIQETFNLFLVSFGLLAIHTVGIQNVFKDKGCNRVSVIHFKRMNYFL